jgi:hypothetical protein
MIEMLKALTPFLVLGMGWLVGNRVSAGWALKQKRRESVHVAVATFQSLYGRWFTLAKLWIVHFHHVSDPSPDGSGHRDREWSLLRETLQTEGEFEAFWLKLSAQYALPAQTRLDMERFREGYQELRRQALMRRGLNWFSTNSAEYRAFKTLAARIVSALAQEELIADNRLGGDSTLAFSAVTSNRHQLDWFVLEDEVMNLPAQTSRERK